MTPSKLFRAALSTRRHLLNYNRLSPFITRCMSSSTAETESLVDERNLLKFDTLASLQANACKNFATNKLFGTYNSDSKAFEWMDYKGFDDKVALTRGVLKDLGT